LSVEKINGGQIFGELMQQLGLDLEKKWAEVKSGQRRFKRRRISAESWQFAQMYVDYRESLKAQTVENEAIAIEPTTANVSAEISPDHPPLILYTDPLFRGGVITEESQGDGQVLEGGDSTQQLVESLKFCHTSKDLALIIQAFNATSEQLQDAIALADSQPRRRQLEGWYHQLSQESVGGGEELAHEEAIATHPPLESYQEADEVWAYYPQSERKWLKSVVQWVRGSTLRVTSGWLGVLIENCHLIAPGDWVLQGAN
jgi:hypothetical protein